MTLFMANKSSLLISLLIDIALEFILTILGAVNAPQQYIGETDRMLKERFAEHKGYVTSNNQTKITGLHFNQRGAQY